MFLTSISVNRPVFATMVMIAIAVIGIFSFQRLAIDQFPDIDFPVVAVVVSYPGASPEAVEADVIKPIEDAMNTLSGIDSIESTAQAGSALVLMFFDLEVDSADASQDVNDRISRITAQLPDSVDRPTVLRFDPSSMAMLSLAVSSESLSPRDLTQLTEDVIIPRLSAIQGVGNASVVGGVSRQLDILVDPDRLNAFGVSIGEVQAAVTGENRDLPAGSIEQGSTVQSIQVEGRIENAEDFLDIIVARRGGQPVRLADVATITEGQSEITSIALLDGQSALAVDVIKTQGANTVEVAESVRAVVADLSENILPDTVILSIVNDSAVEVEQSYHSVQNMLVEGGLLATLIVFLFLNSWRSTVITGLTLPISIIGTMTVIWALGFTLNIMTLLALSLAVGLLIDDAIVVRENIMRHLHMGKSHRQAALDGTKEIGLAVLATTLSIVAVFLPVAFMEGIIGRFFLQFGVTVSVAVLISLFVAFTLDPMMSSVWYDPSAEPNAKRGPLGRLVAQFDRFFEALARGYAGLLRWCLRHRITTLFVAALAFFGSFFLVPFIGAEFAPAVDDSKVQIEIQTAVGSSLSYTSGKLAQVDAVLRQFDQVSGTYGTIASGSAMTGTNTANMTAFLVPPAERAESAAEMSPILRTALEVIPGISVNVASAGGLGGTTAPVQIGIAGESLSVLQPIADELVRGLSAIPGLADVTSSLEAAQPVIGIRVNRDIASDLGVSPAAVSDTLETLLSGATVGDWTSPDGVSFDVTLRLPADQRTDPAIIGAIPVNGTNGLVRLDQVAEIVGSSGPAEINRVDLDRRVTVSANLSDATLGDVTSAVNAVIASIEMPTGYRIVQGGDQEDLAETGASALQAVVMAIIFIYLVLASQFGSFLQPIAIMVSLPLAIVGVLGGLIVGGSTLNIFSMIGFIMLMGLVVKNAILLVDNANKHVEDGMNLYDALVEAGLTRFRPIIMTTLAMIFGMLPLALNLHEGSGQNAPMAHAVIGGLISSTILTLVVVPVVLTYLDSLGRWFQRWFPAPPEHGHAAE